MSGANHSLRDSGPVEMICPRGHTWRTAADEGGIAGSIATIATWGASPTIACPECGAPGAASDAAVGTISGGEPNLGPLFPEDDRVDVPGYDVLAPLGRGGMGVVYKARQERPRRVVALKVLRRPGAGAAMAARFRQEAEAAAKLEHPHIVRVYDVGQTAELQYIAMEYLPGGSLAERLQTTSFSFRQAAETMRDLARAVAFAHERGVLHRDLKPANVLLAADGAPKIADFGLAKQIETAGGDRRSAEKLAALTRSGEVIGTPNYMAPEQATGGASRAGPACDIFALGVMLYEMLCQRRPFVGQDTVEILVKVATEEPVPVRRLSPKAPRDLETICLKCLQKAPARRYASASDLADDLDRFFKGEPIAARPVGPIERAAKWSRRRPAAALALVVAVVAPLALAAGWWWHTSELSLELSRTQAQRARAEANLASAQKAIDDLLDPAGRGSAFDSPAQRRDVLNWALAFCRRLQVENPDSPSLERQAARALRQQADILRLLGEAKNAGLAYDESIERLRRLAAAGDDEIQKELATALNNRGVLLGEQGKSDLCSKSLSESIALYRELAEEHPQEGDYKLRLATAIANGAAAAEESGDFAGAIDGFRQAIELQGEPAKRAETQVRLAGAFAQGEDYDSARRTYEDAIAELTKLCDEPPGDALPGDAEAQRALGAAYHNRALLLAALGENEAAANDYRQAIDRFTSLVEQEPEARLPRQMLADSKLNLGMLYWERETGRGRCEPLWGAAHAAYERLSKEAPGDFAARLGLARSSGGLARIAIAAGDRLGGERDLARAIEQAQALANEFPARAEAQSELAMLEQEAGVSLFARRASADARKHLEKAIESEEAALARQPRSLVFAARMAGHASELAKVCLDQGDVAAAARAADRLAKLELYHDPAALRAAELFARCLPLAGVLKGGASTGGLPLKEWCAARCGELLKEGVADGRIAPQRIAASSDLAPARELPELRALIESLEPKTSDSP